MAQPGRRGPRGESAEPGVAQLTGGGPSQVGVSGAMRARDVSRPSHDDVTAAERLVQVSRRPAGSRPRPQPQPRAQPGSGGSSPDRS